METYIRYIKRTPILTAEKGYSTDFPVDHVPGAKETNQESDMRPVTVTPITDPSTWDIDTHGFCFMRAQTKLDSRGAFERRQEEQGPYWEEMIELLHRRFPGRWGRIEAFDFTVSVE